MKSLNSEMRELNDMVQHELEHEPSVTKKDEIEIKGVTTEMPDQPLEHNKE